MKVRGDEHEMLGIDDPAASKMPVMNTPKSKEQQVPSSSSQVRSHQQEVMIHDSELETKASRKNLILQNEYERIDKKFDSES